MIYKSTFEGISHNAEGCIWFWHRLKCETLGRLLLFWTCIEALHWNRGQVCFRARHWALKQHCSQLLRWTREYKSSFVILTFSVSSQSASSLWLKLWFHKGTAKNLHFSNVYSLILCFWLSITPSGLYWTLNGLLECCIPCKSVSADEGAVHFLFILYFKDLLLFFNEIKIKRCIVTL